MIPYIQFTVFSIGPIPLQVWGFMVALGIFAGTFVATRMARKRGQDESIIWDVAFWSVIGAFLVARLFHVFYEPVFYFAKPLEIFQIWHGGFSVMGGFLGAAIFGVLYLRKKQVDVMAYVDTTIFGLPLGLGIGRIGCFLIHDHPGTLTNFVLGVRYPDGIRHDHGLYLSLNGFLLFLVFLWLARKNATHGTYLMVFLLWYGVVRFILDFFRATDGTIVDVRYGALTPAQYSSLVMIAGGIWLIQQRMSKKN